MSEPIIIETPTTTRERLVLVPPDAVSRTEGGDELLTIRTANARDATPADLERGGYVPLAAQPDPGTLQHLRADLRDAVKERDEAESHAEMRARILTVRAEKAERERDEARRLHSDAEAQVACRNELRAQVAAAEGRFRAAEAERDTLRAELARLAAPGEGACWACREDLGVDHERARQQPEKDRATDEELVDLYRKVYETHGGLTIDVSHGDCRRAAVRAVAARVRQGRCLVAQAVGRGVDVHVTEFVPTQWRVVVVDREATSKTAPCSAADVPATLARLLGEVSRG